MASFWIAFSTSSPQSSVAFLGADWTCLWSGDEMAPRAATGACARLVELGLQETGFSVKDANGFGADLGPGSFTGVRVGVMLAKAMAFASGCETFGASAFDLISIDATVSVPSRKNEWWVRSPGQEPFRSADKVGAGYPDEPASYPHARNFAALAVKPTWVKAVELLPVYLSEPNISTPKKPYAQGPVGGNGV